MIRAPFVPCVILAAAGTLTACTDETTFTAEERAELQTFRLPAGPPPNPSNRVADNPRAAVLGKMFFFDSKFSGVLGPLNDGVTNGSLGKAGDAGKVACTGCHQLDNGGADRRSRPGTVSLGVNYGLRNAPTVINAAYSDVANGGWQLWDGRRDSLWTVALGPLEGANEHAGSRLQYAHIIYDRYRAIYEEVFGEAMPDLSDTDRFPPAGKPGQPTFDGMAMADKGAINRIYANLGKAIEAYERRLVSNNFEPSPFDKMLDGDETAMTPGAVRGARLFIGKAACNECHRGSTFTDFRFHNIGCPQQGEYVASTDVGRSKGIGILKADVFGRAGAFSDKVDNTHLVLPDGSPIMEVERDIGAFRTPGLRNISKTGPYMHNGVYGDLWTVVEHYNFGGNTGAYSGTKESTISPLLLDADEINDLVEFLQSLADGPAKPTPDFPEGLVATPTFPP